MDDIDKILKITVEEGLTGLKNLLESKKLSINLKIEKAVSRPLSETDKTCSLTGEMHTPLTFAIEINLPIEIIQILLQAGADPSAFGHKALRSAIKKNMPDLVKLLVETDATAVNHIFNKMTALEFAFKENRYHIAQLLIHHGARMEKTIEPTASTEFLTPPHVFPEIMVDPELLRWYIYQKKLQDPTFVPDILLHQALTTGASWVDSEGHSPQNTDFYHKELQTIELLIESRANVNAVYSGLTPLFRTAVSRSKERMAFLMHHGARQCLNQKMITKDEKGVHGKTALYQTAVGSPIRNFSVRSENGVDILESAKLLIESGAFIDAEVRESLGKRFPEISKVMLISEFFHASHIQGLATDIELDYVQLTGDHLFGVRLFTHDEHDGALYWTMHYENIKKKIEHWFTEVFRHKIPAIREAATSRVPVIFFDPKSDDEIKKILREIYMKQILLIHCRNRNPVIFFTPYIETYFHFYQEIMEGIYKLELETQEMKESREKSESKETKESKEKGDCKETKEFQEKMDTKKVTESREYQEALIRSATEIVNHRHILSLIQFYCHDLEKMPAVSPFPKEIESKENKEREFNIKQRLMYERMDIAKTIIDAWLNVEITQLASSKNERKAEKEKAYEMINAPPNLDNLLIPNPGPVSFANLCPQYRTHIQLWKMQYPDHPFFTCKRKTHAETVALTLEKTLGFRTFFKTPEWAVSKRQMNAVNFMQSFVSEPKCKGDTKEQMERKYAREFADQTSSYEENEELQQAVLLSLQSFDYQTHHKFGDASSEIKIKAEESKTKMKPEPDSEEAKRNEIEERAFSTLETAKTKNVSKIREVFKLLKEKESYQTLVKDDSEAIQRVINEISLYLSDCNTTETEEDQFCLVQCDICLIVGALEKNENDRPSLSL